LQLGGCWGYRWGTSGLVGWGEARLLALGVGWLFGLAF